MSSRKSVTVVINQQTFSADLNLGIDISIPPRLEGGVTAFRIPHPSVSPLKVGPFVGSVKEGGSCNCEVITMVPHGNGTHTECLGHVTSERVNILDCLKLTHMYCKLISLIPEKKSNGDLIIAQEQLKPLLDSDYGLDSLVIRTLPNDQSKLNRDYFGKNPAYFTPEAANFLASISIKHLLVDLPSVDREDDGGKLAAHRAFWQLPSRSRQDCTITELIYVPDNVVDGYYLLNLQVAGLPSDAAPSRPILFNLLPGL